MNCKISPCIGIIKFPNPMDYASCDSLINLLYIYEKAHISVLDWLLSPMAPSTPL